MEFKTQYGTRKRVYCDSGNATKPVYSPKYEADGQLTLFVTGYENTYDYIQSFKESTDINVILSRFANGDASALSRSQEAYGDFSDVPQSYADMLNLVISGEAAFSKLPVETRALYDHNYAKWLLSFQPESVVPNPVVPKPDPVNPELVVKEVTPNES